jgi:hypothetical protein
MPDAVRGSGITRAAPFVPWQPVLCSTAAEGGSRGANYEFSRGETTTVGVTNYEVVHLCWAQAGTGRVERV